VYKSLVMWPRVGLGVAEWTGTGRCLQLTTIQDHEAGTDVACSAVCTSGESDDSVVLRKDSDRMSVPAQHLTGSLLQADSRHWRHGHQTRKQSSNTIGEHSTLDTGIEFRLSSSARFHERSVSVTYPVNLYPGHF
jgi:hypothetical protein